VDAARQFRTPYSVDNEYLTSARRALQPRRQALRQAFGFPDDVVVVGYSGKLVPWKNVPELVDAVAALQHEGCRVGLLLVGEGRDRAALEQRVGARAMQWVTFTGFRNQSELPACYICFDVFVLPSRRESWGLVLNEAMAFGLPVIATHMAGGAYDLIEEGRNGYIYRSGDGAALTAALRSLVTSAEERARFGRRSEAIVEGYSYDICVSGILDALRYVAPKAEVPA
jgi:glycosyltransferase involved in cell wall biosynthesis